MTSKDSVHTKTSMSSSVAGSVVTKRSVASKKSTNSTSSAAPQKKKCNCCCWSVIIIVVTLLAVAGILIWQFAPIGDALNSVVPAVSPTFGGSTKTNVSTYQFFQCETTDDCCNGLDNICDLKVHDVLFAGTHNSYSSQDEGFQFVFANQYKGVASQLEEGYRGINLDFCGCNNQLVLCHSTCVMTRSPNDVFTEMVTFLNDNPTEILLVTLELNSDEDQPVDIFDVYAEMEAVDGFVDYIYIHPSQGAEWPTLRELKEAGTRMLIFHYRGPQCFSEDPCPDGLLYWFLYAFETSFQFSDPTAITSDYEASCVPDRGFDGKKLFFGINHFTEIPSSSEAKELGTESLLETRIEQCMSVNNNHNVSVILVDFASDTNLLEVTQNHNKALGSRRRGF